MKKKFLLLMFTLVMFLIGGTVRAADDSVGLCKPTQLNELRQMAANVKVTYLPVTTIEDSYPDPETGSTKITKRYLDIKIYNVSSKLYLKATNSDGYEKLFRYTDTGVDGAITLRQPSSSYQTSYVFEVKSDVYGCTDEVLRTVRLTLPKFNHYSDLDICADIPDYYLCQQYTTYTVDGSTFYDRVDEYKAKLLTQADGDDAKEDNTGVVSKTVSVLSKYKYVIVGIVVAVGVVVTVLILRKKKGEN